MAFIEKVAHEPVYAADRERFGFVPNFTRLFARRPATYAAYAELDPELRDALTVGRPIAQS